jgi:hypothetical protein
VRCSLPRRKRASVSARIPRLPVFFRRLKSGRSRTNSAMQRHQLEHIIRAASGITGAPEFVIVGSQAVLGQFPNAPAELLASIEADVFSLRSPAESDLIDGSIGEGSPFHMTFGYYAHGVGTETAILPDGWRERLIPVRNENTGGGTGLCLEVHDLAVSKLAAGRQKDLKFVASLLRYRLAEPRIIEARLKVTPLLEEVHQLCVARLQRLRAGN